MKALTEALKINSNVSTVVLQDNWMSPDAALLISEILRESNSLRILNLQECRLGVEGKMERNSVLAKLMFSTRCLATRASSFIRQR